MNFARTDWLGFVARLRRAFRAFETERTETESTWRLRVQVEPDELDGGWIAECVDLPGCMSQGETREEAIHNVIDAISEVIALRMSQHVPPGEDRESSDPRGREELSLSL